MRGWGTFSDTETQEKVVFKIYELNLQIEDVEINLNEIFPFFWSHLLTFFLFFFFTENDMYSSKFYFPNAIFYSSFHLLYSIQILLGKLNIFMPK